MKCPNCQHDPEPATVKCQHCGKTHLRVSLEKIQNLEYLLTWLEEREQAADLKAEVHKRLRATAMAQLSAAQTTSGLPKPVPQAAPVPAEAPASAIAAPNPVAMAQALALVEGVFRRVPVWVEAGVISRESGEKLCNHLKARRAELLAGLKGQNPDGVDVSEKRVTLFAINSTEVWVQAGYISSVDVLAINQYLAQTSAAVAAPAAPPTRAAPPSVTAVARPEPVVPKPKPVAPPKPPRPPIDWNKVWEKAWGLVVSGALLRGLLYLGAFMIVVSAVVLVVAFWWNIPWFMQLALIAAVPLAFYGSGFYLRYKLKIPVAGGVFTGIGAVLVAVDFAAVYQIGGLRQMVDWRWYWLLASAVCTAIYIFTAWRVRGEFFGYLTHIGLANTAVALASALNTPLEWRIAAMTAAGAAMTGLAGWLRRHPLTGWDELATATRRLPYLLIPVSLFLVVLVPGRPAFGQMAAFGFAALAFGLLAEFFPSVIFAHAMVWSSIGAIGFGLRGLALPPEWFATAAALAAPIYLLNGRLVRQQIVDFIPPRSGYRGVMHLAGFGLLILAVLAGLVTSIVDIWPGVIALTLAAFVLAWCARFFQRPSFAFLASGLFIAPFSFAMARVLYMNDIPQWGVWLMASWSVLASAYLGLAALLRRVERYGASLTLWAHLLTLLATGSLAVNAAAGWKVGTADHVPTLFALGGVIAVYVISAVLHDGGRHPALSRWVERLPSDVRQEIFLWPIGLLIPVWGAVAWWGNAPDFDWFGPVLAALGLAYVGAGQLLAKRKPQYRFPPHVLAYFLAAIGIAVAFGAQPPLMTTLYLAVAVLGALAVVYRRAIETAVAAALFLWPFHLTLQLVNLTPHAFSLAYALLAALGYLPLGLWLNRIGHKFALPHYVISYAVAALSVTASLGGRFGFYPMDVQWVGVLVPLIVAGQQVFSLYRFRLFPFAWAAAAVMPLAFGQALTLLQVPAAYDAACWVGLATAYMLLERGLVLNVSIGSTLDKLREGGRGLRWPLGVGAIGLCGLGLALTAFDTARAFGGRPVADYVPLLMAQGMAIALTVSAARLHRSRWPLFVEPVLAFVAVTLFFIGYGPVIFGAALASPQFGIVWSALGAVHLVAAAVLDRTKSRYSHGLYLGGYALMALAVVWTLAARPVLLWTLGLALAAAVGSAVWVHFKRHASWEELIDLIFRGAQTGLRRAVHGAFQWAAAWPFPIWCVLLLNQLNVADGFLWLGFGLPAIAMLGLAVRLRRIDPAYGWPLNAASQFYVAVSLLFSLPVTVQFLGGNYLRTGPALAFVQIEAAGFAAVQAAAGLFYIFSARAFRRRLFAHVAAWLAFAPYTTAWLLAGLPRTEIFALAWIGLAAGLMGIGYTLDRNRVRYAHGPYLAGYALAGFGLAWSTTDRAINLWALAAVIALALASHTVAHYGRHLSFNDFVGFFWRREGTAARRAAQTVFLFVAAYGFPVWLAQFMAHNAVPLAWRGLGLALAAPIYIAFGLAARRVRAEYTWPLYSAGYALTAIGAMVSFENQALAIYVLSLNTVVYAASAYIFRQSFWLYLSNALLPIIGLLTLHYNQSLTSPWVAGLFMGLAFVYFGLGQWFNRRRPASTGNAPVEAGWGVNEFALAFHAPAYVLSAVAMAVASGETGLALGVYSAGVVLYALSARLWREPVFLYPAVWLFAVPYYLLLTLTALPPEWHGLGWLPLIAACILIGKFVFHKTPLGSFADSARKIWNAEEGDLPAASGRWANTFAHPALPFYLLAYVLSVSMIVVSQPAPLIFTLALAAGAVIYFGSAALFRRPAWVYPALFAAHLALATYLTIQPSGQPAQYISLPFLGLTWLIALVGYAFSRRWPVARQTETGQPVFKFMRWELRFGAIPSIGHLLTPSWAQPFFIFTLLDVIFWLFVSLGRYDTALIVSVGFMLLLMLFAMLWRDSALAYGTLGLCLLALGYRLDWAGLPFADRVAVVGGAGFGLYLMARLAERITAGSGAGAPAALSVWPNPLTRTALVISGAAVVVTLPFVLTRTIATAAALASAGALYLTLAFRGRYYRLGYAAMAMLQVAWVLILLFVKVGESQLYAIPAGLYFTGMGYLERRRSNRLFGIVIETFGLAVLLLTSFIQSLNSGSAGLFNFVLLLVEGLLVIWWGAAQRLKSPFFIGLAASALNVAGQIVVLFSGGSTFTRWAIIGSAGILLVTAAVFVERQRTRIIAKAQEWREALEKWE